MHERTFFTKEQAAAWRQYSYRNFHPEPKRPLTECPPPKAVILGRTQGVPACGLHIMGHFTGDNYHCINPMWSFQIRAIVLGLPTTLASVCMTFGPALNV
jgi:hypothetical protein